MNAFNRIVVGVFALVLFVVSVVVVAVAVGLVPPERALPGAFFHELLTPVAALEGVGRTAAIGSAGLAALVGLLLLILEIRPSATGQRPFLVREEALGALTVERLSVCLLAERVIRESPGVVGARAAVADGEQGIRVRCRVAAAAGANLPELGPQLQTAVKAAVEKQVGLPVEQVALRMRLDAARSHRPVLQ